jgi:hypothetical protein
MPYRVDANQAQIVEVFRERGAVVDITARVGNGFPDIVVNYTGLFAAVEIKTETGKLRTIQSRWYGAHRGLRFVVRDVDDVDAVLDCMRRISELAKEVLDDCCD